MIARTVQKKNEQAYPTILSIDSWNPFIFCNIKMSVYVHSYHHYIINICCCCSYNIRNINNRSWINIKSHYYYNTVWNCYNGKEGTRIVFPSKQKSRVKPNVKIKKMWKLFIKFSHKSWLSNFWCVATWFMIFFSFTTITILGKKRRAIKCYLSWW